MGFYDTIPFSSACFGTFWTPLSNFWNYFLRQRTTDEGLVPEMCILSILVIQSVLNWCIRLNRSTILYYSYKHIRRLEKSLGDSTMSKSHGVCLVFITILSMVLFVYDVASDIALAVAYSNEDNHTVEFGLTIGYIVVPAIIYNSFCALIIYLNSSSLKSPKVLIQLFFTFPLLLGPLVMNVQFFFWT